jgi:hypothetical protein
VLRTKATGFEFLKKKMREQGLQFETDFLAKLSADEVDLYWKALPISWVDLNNLSHVFEIAAAMLFPNHPRPLIEFGREEAQHAMTGLYKVLLRLATVPMIVQKTAVLWKVYYESGQARAEFPPDKKQASLIVTNYPELPYNNRTIVLGYTLGLLDLTGAKNIRYDEDYHDPLAWRWNFYWG